jgi:hypothetical protein
MPFGAFQFTGIEAHQPLSNMHVQYNVSSPSYLWQAAYLQAAYLQVYLLLLLRKYG